jgi:hypothetical protein
MARPAKLLGFALCSALLVPAMPLAAEAAQSPLSGVEGDGLRWVGDRFLNGNGAGNQGSRQEPVTLSATQDPRVLWHTGHDSDPRFLGRK